MSERPDGPTKRLLRDVEELLIRQSRTIKNAFKMIGLDYSSFVGLDCSLAELQDENFSGICLDRAKFRGSNLRGATFRGASLVGTDFRDALLEGADFTAANLTGAVFDAGYLNEQPHAAVRDGRAALADPERIAAAEHEVIPNGLLVATMTMADRFGSDAASAALSRFAARHRHIDFGWSARGGVVRLDVRSGFAARTVAAALAAEGIVQAGDLDLSSPTFYRMERGIEVECRYPEHEIDDRHAPGGRVTIKANLAPTPQRRGFWVDPGPLSGIVGRSLNDQLARANAAGTLLPHPLDGVLLMLVSVQGDLPAAAEGLSDALQAALRTALQGNHLTVTKPIAQLTAYAPRPYLRAALELLNELNVDVQRINQTLPPCSIDGICPLDLAWVIHERLREITRGRGYALVQKVELANPAARRRQASEAADNVVQFTFGAS